ncbi:tRNA dihydrouridine synthase DusB [Treponema parvum]|uniref:tRNA-dihydrouridine synthase n=1 Tax=Treponema parvum TaxID=138851 RepID=A0A975IBK6_9SPIR|nr:tRNA dihydrouridine synthase DusB [Treponema parvum]QTQ10918.1 tRNA dihydrouridine synthase DusB [Treponema parvum]
MLYHPVKIGSLTLPGNLFLAPVAGYSDRAFRCVCVDGGADFTYTEMVSSEALTRGSSKTEILMRKAPNEKAYAVQLFGSNPATMALAARLVLEKTGADCIDINAGCPVPKIIKTGAGSALIRDPEKLFALVSAVVKAVDKKVPVTVKIRSGWDADHITWKESAQAVIDAGASAVTLHARTRAQGYEGKSDWNILRSLVEFIGGKIPVFGSGDVFLPEDAKAMLETTGCDAVMFARGAMGHPFIFRQTRQLLRENFYEEIGFEERIEAGFKELSLLISDKGEDAACREMRKRFCAYSKGAAGGAELRRRIVSASREQDYKNIFRL